MSSFPLERAETVAMVWPKGHVPPPHKLADGFELRFATDYDLFVQVQDAIGWHVDETQWHGLLEEMVPDSMAFILKGGRPIAAACALTRLDGWVELAWVAVDAEFRKLGLGKSVCSELIQHLLTSGYSSIYGSTQDKRLSALNIYLNMGFHPVYRTEKVNRWVNICCELAQPFHPDLWNWP